MTARSEFHKSPNTWLREGIDAVVGAHPDLSAAGWRTIHGRNSNSDFVRYRVEMALPNFEEMVFDALLELARSKIKSGSWSYDARGSMSLRIGRYINNGALIVAAILVGYEPIRRSGDESCRFRMPRSAKLHRALRGGDYDRGWSA